MHQLTETGLHAMAAELLRLASNGEQRWADATPELQQDLRGFVDRMVDAARDAEIAARDTA